MANADYVVLAELASVHAALMRQMDQASRLARDCGASVVRRIEGAGAEVLWRAALSLGVPTQGGPGFSTRATVLPSATGQMIEAHETFAREHGLECASAAGLGTGVVQARWWPVDEAQALAPSAARAIVDALGQRARQASGAFAITAAPPELKKGLDVWGPAPASLALMQALKQQFDPKGVLNPGRFVGGI
jgi:glycolate oxidase FAD binding subunit